MKQSDIFTLILIAGIGTLAAFFLCNAIMGDPDLATTEFKTLSSVIDSLVTDYEVSRLPKNKTRPSFLSV